MYSLSRCQPLYNESNSFDSRYDGNKLNMRYYSNVFRTCDGLGMKFNGNIASIIR